MKATKSATLALLALTLAYLALPRPAALGSAGLLLDGHRIAPQRLLAAERAPDGVKVQLEWRGWLIERSVPPGAAAEALLARFAEEEEGAAELLGGEDGPPEETELSDGEAEPSEGDDTQPAD